MSQLGEAVVSDGPAKSWAIGSAGSAPSSSRVRTPHSDNIITFTYFFDFVMLCLPSIRLASELIVHETCLMISLYIMRTERKTCVGDYTYFFFINFVI